MPFVYAFRYVIQALFSRARGLTPPGNLRFELGAEAAGSYPVTIRWNAPSSWGDDEGGAGTRDYTAGYRQLLNADGSAHTGTYADWTPTAALAADDLDYNPPNAPENSVWEFRIRAQNRNNAPQERSAYATLTYHARVAASSRSYGHQYSRHYR